MAVLILLSSLLAVLYIGRVVEVAYFRPAPEGAGPVKRAPLSMLAPMWVLCAGCVYFGVAAGFTSEVAHTAARVLFGGAW